MRTEFSTFQRLLEPMLAAVGFTIMAADFQDSIFATYTCVKA